MPTPYQVIKFYCYTPIEDPQALREAHHLLGIKHQLQGRIKVATEGLNGTLSGSPEACQAYIDALKKDPRFAHVSISRRETPQPVHTKLRVKIKPEIVHAGFPDMKPHPNPKERGYISAQDFYQLRKDPQVQVIDVRSTYEHALGKFENAITVEAPSFREVLKKLEELTLDEKKTYVVCCTGGIKSEKGCQYLKEKKKLPRVYLLEDGIIGYGQQTDGAGFQGVCYVFDQQLTVEINRKDPSVISHCYHCKTPSFRMINCAQPICNQHIPMCPACSDQLEGACSPTCQQAAEKRPYDGSGYYLKKQNGYHPYDAMKKSHKAFLAHDKASTSCSTS